MNPTPGTKGYLQLCLRRDNEAATCKIHRLVAEAFIPNPDNKPYVNHLNGIKTDNRVENLEWVTSSENQRHAYDTGLNCGRHGEDNPRAKLTNEQVRYIRDNPDNLSTCRLAEMFKVTPTTISDIQCGKKYQNAGGVIRKAKPRPPRVPDDVRNEIRRLFVKGSSEFGACALAKKYGCVPTTILNIVRER